MIGQMAIAIALPGFNDLGRSVKLFFFSWIMLSSDFLRLTKNEENPSIRSLIFFCKMHNRILRLSVRRFQMPLGGLSFVKALATFGIINATDSLIQNFTRIVCLR